MRISYLGPAGTYSEKAALKLSESMHGCELSPELSLESVAKKVHSGSSGLGVMAYYNHLEGLVQECLDIIYENKLQIVGMQRVPITFSIASYPGSRDSSAVYSHPKALAQCSAWLLANCPDSRQIAVESTAAGAIKVMESKAGLAIASKNALEECNLSIVAEDISNRRHGSSNFTDFYLVSKDGLHPEPVMGKDYLTMVAITPHFDKVGLLAGILQQTAWHELNNAKIHSRPAIDDVRIEDNLEPQMFYLELRCHMSSKRFNEFTKSIENGLNPGRKSIEVVRILGSYENPCFRQSF